MPWKPTIRRPFAAEVAAATAAVAVPVCARVLPWHRSGSVRRDAFALARVADEIGLVAGGGRRVLFVGVFLLPVLAAATFLAVAAARPRVAGVSASAVGVIGLASAAVVLRVSGGHQIGPVMAAMAALIAVGCGVSLILGRGPVDDGHR
jgi:hypothetical protein